MKMIDLSHALADNETVFPGDSEFSLVCQKNIEEDGYTLYHLETDLHVGTHIDAPIHLSQQKETIQDIPLERCCGEAILLDVRGKNIISSEQEWQNRIQQGQIVLLYTGWSRYYGQAKYYQHYPVIDDSFTDLLIKKKIKMLGMDSCSPDQAPYPQHEKLLENGILLLENLTNLHELLAYPQFYLTAFPINWKAEASFVRAVAQIKES